MHAIRFDQVSKQFRTRHNRSFREWFVSLGPTPPRPDGPDQFWALRNISFEIQPGESVGLIGHNGAGKSTALKLIGRLMTPSQGRLEIHGRVSALLELGAGFHPELSGRDNVFLSGALLGLSRRDMAARFDAIVDFSEIEEFIDMPVKHYSSGMFARLAFAVSANVEPEILLVDEALAVGDIRFVQKCLAHLDRFRARGGTLLFVSHDLPAVQRLCGRVIWLDRGRLCMDGPPREVTEAYFDSMIGAPSPAASAAQGRESGIGSGESGIERAPATAAEHWILARLALTLAEVEAQMKLYRFDLVAQALYEFVWNDYCDWFLELSKPALNGEDAAAAASTRSTLLRVLEAILRALHPITPFITEEIWQSVAPKLGISGNSVAERPYPRAAEFADATDAQAVADIEWLKAVLGEIRRIRSEMNIAPGKQIPLLFAKGAAADRTRVERFAEQIAFLARTESQAWLDAGQQEPASASAIVGELRVLIPLAGLIDIEAEKARLNREIKRIESEITKCNGKLGNATFVANAPAAVVEQERGRLAEFSTTLSGLNEQLGRL